MLHTEEQDQSVMLLMWKSYSLLHDWTFAEVIITVNSVLNCPCRYKWTRRLRSAWRPPRPTAPSFTRPRWPPIHTFSISIKIYINLTLSWAISFQPSSPPSITFFISTQTLTPVWFFLYFHSKQRTTLSVHSSNLLMHFNFFFSLLRGGFTIQILTLLENVLICPIFCHFGIYAIVTPMILFYSVIVLFYSVKGLSVFSVPRVASHFPFSPFYYPVLLQNQFTLPAFHAFCAASLSLLLLWLHFLPSQTDLSFFLLFPFLCQSPSSPPPSPHVASLLPPLSPLPSTIFPLGSFCHFSLALHHMTYPRRPFSSHFYAAPCFSSPFSVHLPSLLCFPLPSLLYPLPFILSPCLIFPLSVSLPNWHGCLSWTFSHSCMQGVTSKQVFISPDSPHSASFPSRME